MLNALQLSRPTRRAAALLAALLCVLSAAGPLSAPAGAQGSLIAPPQTKEEAAQAREEASEQAARNAGGSTIPLEVWLGGAGLLLLGGATFYMLRDSRDAVAGEGRSAPERAFTPSTTRGAPKTMFEGEAKPGGQVGKAKKRQKTKRQKQARRANRPR